MPSETVVHALNSLVVVTVLAFISGCKDGQIPKEIGSGTSDVTQSDRAHDEASFRERLGRLKFQSDRLALALEQLEQERQVVVSRLRSLGIKSSSDIESNPIAEHLATDLVLVTQEIDQRKSQLSDFEEAIQRLEICLRQQDRLARLDRSDISDRQLDELSKTFHESEDMMLRSERSPLMNALHVETVLKEQLGDQASH